MPRKDECLWCFYLFGQLCSAVTASVHVDFPQLVSGVLQLLNFHNCIFTWFLGFDWSIQLLNQALNSAPFKLSALLLDCLSMSLSKNTCKMEPAQTFIEIFDMVSKSWLCPTAHSLAYLTLLYFKGFFLRNTLFNANFIFWKCCINEAGICMIITII